MVAAGNMEGNWSRIRFQGRNGGLQHHRCGIPGPYSQPRPNFVHSDNVIGDPNSLSGARLQEEVTSVSGVQALGVLS